MTNNKGKKRVPAVRAGMLGSGNLLSTKGLKRSTRAWGMVCGVLAAVCYGTNPLGALKLYAEGMSTGSVLFYRFGLAWLIIVVVLLLRHESLRVSRKEFWVLLGLGGLFSVSSLTLYLSFDSIVVCRGGFAVWRWRRNFAVGWSGACIVVSVVVCGVYCGNEPERVEDVVVQD